MCAISLRGLDDSTICSTSSCEEVSSTTAGEPCWACFACCLVDLVVGSSSLLGISSPLLADSVALHARFFPFPDVDAFVFEWRERFDLGGGL